MRRRRATTGMLAVALLLAAVLLTATSCATSGSGADSGGIVRVSGSTTVNPVAADAAEVLRREGLRVTVDAQGGSAGGIAQLGRGQVEVAMTSKPLDEADRRAFPATEFVATEIGADAVGIVVRRQVFDGGVRNLEKGQLRALFEGRIRNWRELGGPDLAVLVYDKEPGRGTREVIDGYLYGGGEGRPGQGNNVAVVGGNEEGRAKVLSTPGGVTPLSTSFLAGHPGLVAVAVDGVEPEAANVVGGSYPLARPLFLVTDGPAAGAARTFVDYVTSEEGQAIVRTHGFLSLAELGRRP